VLKKKEKNKNKKQKKTNKKNSAAEQRLSNFSHPKISLGFEFLYVFTTLDFINCSN
jgi:hypothetical protein